MATRVLYIGLFLILLFLVSSFNAATLSIKDITYPKQIDRESEFKLKATVVSDEPFTGYYYIAYKIRKTDQTVADDRFLKQSNFYDANNEKLSNVVTTKATLVDAVGQYAISATLVYVPGSGLNPDSALTWNGAKTVGPYEFRIQLLSPGSAGSEEGKLVLIEDAPPPPECTSNAGCPADKFCSSGSCVAVQTGTCGQIVDHAWSAYQCCADSNCEANFICSDHLCVENVSLEPETTTPAVNSSNARDGTSTISTSKSSSAGSTSEEFSFLGDQNVFLLGLGGVCCISTMLIVLVVGFMFLRRRPPSRARAFETI